MTSNKDWEIIELEKGTIILPAEPKYCPFCGTAMLLHRFVANRLTQRGFKHADINLKCPSCGFWCVFGIPISDVEYEKLRKSPLHGLILTDEVLGYTDKTWYAEIKRRLEALGYW